VTLHKYIKKLGEDWYIYLIFPNLKSSTNHNHPQKKLDHVQHLKEHKETSKT
jgi:hypothetical protein